MYSVQSTPYMVLTHIFTHLINQWLTTKYDCPKSGRASLGAAHFRLQSESIEIFWSYYYLRAGRQFPQIQCSVDLYRMDGWLFDFGFVWNFWGRIKSRNAKKIPCNGLRCHYVEHLLWEKMLISFPFMAQPAQRILSTLNAIAWSN